MRLTASGFGILAALAVLAAPLSAAAPPKAAHTEILDPAARGAAATVDAFHAALRRGDTRAAAALLVKDALIFEAGGVERSKAEYAAHHLPADAEFSRAVSSAVTRRIGRADGAVAWIASEGRTTGTYKGRALDLRTTETMILRRAGGVWHIVHIHWSSSR
ncbi:MAG: nuclear transport factor 2 family protein [Sphingomicrobium sp.]